MIFFVLKEDKSVGQNDRLTNFASKFAAMKIKMKVPIKKKITMEMKKLSNYFVYAIFLIAVVFSA